VGKPHIRDYTSLLGAHLLGLLVCLTTSSACLISISAQRTLLRDY
jgi:hypothetical protein